MDVNAARDRREETKQQEKLANDYDMVFIHSPNKQKHNSVECTLNEELAVFYSGETSEFTIIDVEAFVKIR